MENDLHKRCLQRCHTFLLKELDADSLADRLYEKEIFNNEHVEIIQSNNLTRTEKNRQFLGILRRSGMKGYTTFKSILQERETQRHIYDKIVTEEENLKSQLGKDISDEPPKKYISTENTTGDDESAGFRDQTDTDGFPADYSEEQLQAVAKLEESYTESLSGDMEENFKSQPGKDISDEPPKKYISTENTTGDDESAVFRDQTDTDEFPADYSEEQLQAVAKLEESYTESLSGDMDELAADYSDEQLQDISKLEGSYSESLREDMVDFSDDKYSEDVLTDITKMEERYKHMD